MFGFNVAAVEKAKAAGGRLALLMEPGYCKTVTALTVLADLQAWPALVVAPPRVARQVWSDEAGEWGHLRNVSVAHLGDPMRRQTEDWERERFQVVLTDGMPALDEDAHVETVSYENLFWLSEHVDLRRRYRGIVFDELSKMKTPGTQRFKRMRGSAMDIPVRLGLTGNPVGNHHLDLWGEMFMVAGERALGPTFTGYRERYFAPVDFMQRVWELKHSPSCPKYDDQSKACACALARECEREIARRIAPHSYVLPEQREVEVPRWVPNVVEVQMPDGVLRNHRELHEQLFTMLESGTELEAIAASAVAQKCRQLASGAVYVDEGVRLLDVPWAEEQAAFEDVHDAKLDAVDELLDEMQGSPCLLFYWYRHEQARLEKRLKRAGRRYAFGASPQNLARWNAGELEVLGLHPNSAGHGLNLQHGGSRAICTTVPWSWEALDQCGRRLARVGQKAPVVPFHLLSCGPADARVLPLVYRKAETERRLFADLRALA